MNYLTPPAPPRHSLNKWGGYVQFPGPVEASEPHSNCDELCRLVCIPVADVLESLINSMPGDVVQHARQLEVACDTYLRQGMFI